jgi:F-type H+-transporting ATPase subunit b
MVLLAQAHEEPSGIDLIIPAVDELIWGAVAFVIAFVVLTKLAFPALQKGIQDRSNKIQGDLEAAENARAEADRMLEDYKRQMAEARSEANKVIEEARQQAEQVRRDIIAKAEKDAEQIVTRAQQQLEAERTRTIQELQGTISDLSIELAEKVVGRSIDASAQRELVDAYIQEVSGMSTNGGRR